MRMNVDVQEGASKNVDLHFENVDYSHCFEITDSKIKVEDVNNENNLGNGQENDNLHQDMDTGLESKIKLEKLQGDKCQNNDFCLENVDCSHLLETTGSVDRDIDNLRNNIDTGLRKLKQEVEVNEAGTEDLHSTFVHSNIYIFENGHSHFRGENDVENNMLVDILNIKQEITEHHEEISNLKDKKDFQDEKYNFNLQDAEISEFSILTDNSCLEAQGNSDLNLNPENGTTTNEKSDCRLEKCVMDIDTSDFTYEKTDLNIEKCDSGNGAVGFMKVEFDSEKDTLGVDNCRLTIETDLQPTVMSKELPGSVFNQGSPAYRITVDPYQCNVCDKIFRTESHLKNHASFHSSEQTMENLKNDKTSASFEHPHHCHLCDKQFQTTQLLKQHMTIHSSVYQCNVCGLSINNSHVFKQHMIAHSTEQPRKCNICQKEFKLPSLLRRHLVTHSDERPYKCNICKKPFKNSVALKLHRIAHSNERPYKCDKCVKEFKSSGSLRRHVRNHSKERIYKCDICPREFYSSPRLNYHMKYHNNERPYKCDKCVKDFKTSGSLKRHLRAHSTERPYKCDVCWKKYKKSYYFRKHMITHRTE